LGHCGRTARVTVALIIRSRDIMWFADETRAAVHLRSMLQYPHSLARSFLFGWTDCRTQGRNSIHGRSIMHASVQLQVSQSYVKMLQLDCNRPLKCYREETRGHSSSNINVSALHSSSFVATSLLVPDSIDATFNGYTIVFVLFCLAGCRDEHAAAVDGIVP
jgi:hypothetical protein